MDEKTTKRRRHLLDDTKASRRCWNLKEEALDHASEEFALVEATDLPQDSLRKELQLVELRCTRLDVIH